MQIGRSHNARVKVIFIQVWRSYLYKCEGHIYTSVKVIFIKVWSSYLYKCKGHMLQVWRSYLYKCEGHMLQVWRSYVASVLHISGSSATQSPVTTGCCRGQNQIFTSGGRVKETQGVHLGVTALDRGYLYLIMQFFKLLPKRHIFFDLVIRFIRNRKYAFFCIF